MNCPKSDEEPTYFDCYFSSKKLIITLFVMFHYITCYAPLHYLLYSITLLVILHYITYYDIYLFLISLDTFFFSLTKTVDGVINSLLNQ